MLSPLRRWEPILHDMLAAEVVQLAAEVEEADGTAEAGVVVVVMAAAAAAEVMAAVGAAVEREGMRAAAMWSSKSPSSLS